MEQWDIEFPKGWNNLGLAQAKTDMEGAGRRGRATVMDVEGAGTRGGVK